jgi:hypothetical protein
VGVNDGNRTEGTTYYNTGMKFGEFDPTDIQETVWGTSSVTFHNCNSATLEYSSNDSAYGSGTIPMTPVIPVSGNNCSDSPLHGTYSVSLTEQGEIGIGYALLFENGQMTFFSLTASSGSVGLGGWRVSGVNQFEFGADVYSMSGGTYVIEGSGTFNEDALTANYTNSGQLIAHPIPSFQHTLDTQNLAGVYSIQDMSNSFTGTVTFESDGKIVGSTSDGCTLNGTFWIPNIKFNQAQLDVDVSTCADAGKITGGLMYNYATGSINVMGSDGYYGNIWILSK